MSQRNADDMGMPSPLPMTQPISPEGDASDDYKAGWAAGAKAGVEAMSAVAVTTTLTDPPKVDEGDALGKSSGGLVERLRRGRLMQEGSGNWGDLYQSAHPDAIEAADRIQSLIADNERLREALTECADDLEVEVRNRWGDDERLAHKLKRDLSPVVKARTALSHKDMSK